MKYIKRFDHKIDSNPLAKKEAQAKNIPPPPKEEEIIKSDDPNFKSRGEVNATLNFYKRACAHEVSRYCTNYVIDFSLFPKLTKEKYSHTEVVILLNQYRDNLIKSAKSYNSARLSQALCHYIDKAGSVGYTKDPVTNKFKI